MDGEKFSGKTAVSLAIGGINVKFPVKPYPSQLSMMSMIIRGLEKQQHCLLESPTGSGKSLALLCSALAWQQAQYKKLDDELILKLKLDAENNNPPCTCEKSNKLAAEETGPSTSRYFNGDKTDNAISVIDLCTPDDEDDDFKIPGKPSREPKSKPEIESCCKACNSGKGEGKDSNDEQNVRRPRVPKIWFGTRTHKQIAQISKELGRTSYDTVKMTILSSRQHSCIHPAVMKSANKSEDCRDLRRGKHISGAKCAFYHNVHRMKNHFQLSCAGMGSAWDLEELVGLGKTIKACPFYSARELVASSSLIFCPYNYLIDPMIRSQMKINMNNQIIILDEAHNIEDSARDAGSFTLTEDNLANTTADLEYLINDGIKTDDHRPLHLLCMRLGQWISQHSRNLKSSDYETSSEVWYGRDIITHLREWGITEDTLPLLEGNYGAAIDLGEEDIETAKLLHSSSQATLGGLFNVLRYLMNGDYKYCDDYRVTIIRQSVFGAVPPKRTRDGWVTLHKKSKKHFVTNLHFWCLNPAVAFSDLSKAHCIILTSGTLSPMSSFSSELGLSFPIQLEANHVIQDSQVWVGSIGKGPKGIQLEATYKNTDKFEFQDELGELVNQICRIVPYGVLCFFSSYSMLQKLQDRWKTTGTWDRIQEVKVIVCEPRSSNKDEFDSILQSFYDAINESETDGDITGGLLLAVCRGKVSEGLDFADNNARAVITVGIPFPNIKDKQVELKRKYNDIHKSQRGLLSGGQWYEIQAYRAMNQALGRCIRHRNDWGALIIVDDRFCKNPQKYSKGLSKWVRQKMRPQMNYENALSNITAFVQGWTSKHGSLMLNGTCSPSAKASTTLPLDTTPIRITKEVATTHFLQTDQVQTEDSSPEKMSPTIELVKSKKLNFTSKAKMNEQKTTDLECTSTCVEASRTPLAMITQPRTEPLKRNDSKSKIYKKSGKSKKTVIEGDFSDDDIEFSSDEDFEISMVHKTPNHSNKKNLRKSSKNFKKKHPLASIESDYLDTAVANAILPEEDLFDCTIPATPEKIDLTIVPESPASRKKEPSQAAAENTSKIWQALDFSKQQPITPQSSRKRKSSSRSHMDNMTPSLKHTDPSTRKELCSETETAEKDKGSTVEVKDEVSDLAEQGSGELLPRSKRRMRTKNDQKKPSPTSRLQCKNCKTSLHTSTFTHETENFESKYLSSQVSIKKKKSKSACKVYIVDTSAVTAGSLTPMSVNLDQGPSVELNSYWCSEDRRCYQAFICSNCSHQTAFKVVSDQTLEQKYLFPQRLVKHEAE